MAESLWSQDSFTSGELSPLMYSRITVDNYYNGLKLAKNAITLPQGAVEKRFGLKHYADVPYANNYDNVRLAVFEYLDQCTYQLLFLENSIFVYLEGNQIAEVQNTGYTTEELQRLVFTTLEDQFIITSKYKRPQKLGRTSYSQLIDSEFFVDALFNATVPENILQQDKVYSAYLTIGRSRLQFTANARKTKELNPTTRPWPITQPGSEKDTGYTAVFEIFFTATAGQTLPSNVVAGTSYWAYMYYFPSRKRYATSLYVYNSEAGAIAKNPADQISFANENTGLITVSYYLQSNTATLPTPLSLLSSYFVRLTNSTTITFYNTLADAQAQINPVILTSQGVAPYFLHAHDGSNLIVNIDTATNIVEFTDPLPVDIILPVKFGNIDQLSATPIINVNNVYFIKTSDTTHGKVYTTAEDARDDVNAIVFGTFLPGSFFTAENQWSIQDIEFKNTPVYDFNELNYENIDFSVTNGAGVTTQTLTASSGIFSEAYIGGAFIGGGGICRITEYLNTTQMRVEIKKVFDSTANPITIKGKVALLLEPAWSDSRGWPTVCSSFQNRLILANNESLRNGIWLSTINAYTDFDDIDTDDDDAISWYPSSNEVNLIKFIVPYRSLTVHTNTGVYSTGLGANDAITPRNFSLILQESTPATVIQPRAIDNQVIVVSGSDVQSMLWDAYNNSYQTNIVSVMSEHLIREPIDEAPYRDINRAGSRYVFLVNDDGTLAIYQTLLAENISGFTLAELEQSYGSAQFKAVESSSKGRAWFAIDREIAEQENNDLGLNSVAATVLTTVGSNFDTVWPTRVTTLSQIEPVTVPQITDFTEYWVKGINANDFSMYPTRADAVAGINAISFADVGEDFIITEYLEHAITAVATTTVTAPSSNFNTTRPTAFKFSADTLPGLTVTVPAQDPINQTDYFWAVGIDANNFKVFRNQSDANSDTNAVSFADAGVNAHIAKWDLAEKLYIEELDFTKYMDCADEYLGAATTSVPVDARYNAQNLLMNADGVKYEGIVANETFTTTANVTDAQYGFGIHFKAQPLALANAIGSSIKQTNLVFPKHVRSVTMMYNDTIGGSVNGKTMSSLDGNGTQLFEIATMKSWDDFRNTSITIEHTEPYPIRLLGLYYKIDI